MLHTCRTKHWPICHTAVGYSAWDISEVRKSYCDGPLIDPKYHITVVTKYINIVTEVRIHNVKTILYPRVSLFLMRILSIIKKLGTTSLGTFPVLLGTKWSKDRWWVTSDVVHISFFSTRLVESSPSYLWSCMVRNLS